MKKIFSVFLIAALLLPLMLSCKKDNTPKTVPTGSFINSAKSFSSNLGYYITFNADGKFLALKEATKAVRTYELIKGTYTDNQSTYTMYVNDKEWGTLRVVSNDKVHVTISELHIDNDLDVEVHVPDLSNEIQRASNHSWKPVSSVIKYKGLNYSNSGVDLNHFLNWAEKMFGDIEEVFEDGMKMNEAYMSDSGIAFFFENGQQLFAHIDWQGDGKFYMKPISLSDSEKLNLFEGEATISIDQDKMIFSVAGEFNNEEVEVTIVFGL